MASRRLAAVLVLGGLLLSACGKDNKPAEGTPASGLSPVAEVTLPATIAGLNVAPEKVTKALKDTKRTYFDQVSLFSLRKGKLVMATLEVGQFGSNSRYLTSDFRNDVVYQLAGGGQPNTVIVGSDTVYLTRGTKQSLAVWFHGRYEYLMSIREDYTTPRQLIRETLAVTR